MTHRSPHSSLAGFTLLELLVGTAIFTVILGSLMAVLISLQKADLFRDRYSIVTQAERSAYEPIVRAVKAANAEESIYYNNQCYTVRGFYLVDSDGMEKPVFNATDTGLTLQALQPSQILVTVSAEDSYDRATGPTKHWVKREYQVSPHPDDSRNQTIMETTYRQSPGREWPKPLLDDKDINECKKNANKDNHWKPDSNKPARALTVPRASVVKFGLRMASDRRDANRTPSTYGPFLTLEIATAYADPKVSQVVRNTIPTLTLRSTVTPTFTYGVIHD